MQIPTPQEPFDHSITFAIGTAGDLYDIFSFSPALVADKSLSALSDAIGHAINQTLLRDGLYSAWAQVNYHADSAWNDATPLSLRITSPFHPVAAYEAKVTAFFNALQMAYATWEQIQPQMEAYRKALVKKVNAEGGDVTEADYATEYLPPFGLSMVHSLSVQLLHYPPAETLTYMDYLYSPTNRRWENLLGWNGWPGEKNRLLETIVDVAPVAASGGSNGSQVIAPFIEAFAPYVETQLRALLRVSPSGARTTPMVAYGGPVGEWLCQNYGDQIRAQGVQIIVENEGAPDQSERPAVCETFFLRFFGAEGPETPVICANHPISFNYYDGDYTDALRSDDPKTQTMEVDENSAIVLSQDLICAGWQAEMARLWPQDPDPKTVRSRMFKRWGLQDSENFDRLLVIFREQITEFSLSAMPEVNTEIWAQQLEQAMAEDGATPG